MFSLFSKIGAGKKFGWEGDEATEIVTRSFEEGIIKSGDRVLDMGCGFGRNANWLVGKGVIVTAVDINKDEIKDAENRAKKMGVIVNYLLANAIELPFFDHSFEVVLDLGCTHMISDKNSQKKAELEVARVLGPGGRLIYFGFSKKHPDYKNKPYSSMFRDLEEIELWYGEDFEILSCEEHRWQAKLEEGRNFTEHVGLNIIMRRKNREIL